VCAELGGGAVGLDGFKEGLNGLDYGVGLVFEEELEKGS